MKITRRQLRKLIMEQLELAGDFAYDAADQLRDSMDRAKIRNELQMTADWIYDAVVPSLEIGKPVTPERNYLIDRIGNKKIEKGQRILSLDDVVGLDSGKNRHLDKLGAKSGHEYTSIRDVIEMLNDLQAEFNLSLQSPETDLFDDRGESEA